MDRFELRRLDYSLTEDHVALQDAYKQFFTSHCGIETVRAAEESGFDKSLWERLCAMGATTMALPESAGGDGATGQSGQGDLVALRPYAAGDPPQRIAWKAVARSGAYELVSVQLGEAAQDELVFDWGQLPSTLDDEAKLSRLTRWIIDADQAGQRYSLRLPGTIIESGAGPVQRARCLEALAVWGLS